MIKIGGAPPPAEAVCGSEKKVQQCLFVGKEFVSWDFFFFFFFFKISSDCKYKYVPKCGALGKYKPLTVKAILGTTKLCLEDRRVAAQVGGGRCRSEGSPQTAPFWPHAATRVDCGHRESMQLYTELLSADGTRHATRACTRIGTRTQHTHTHGFRTKPDTFSHVLMKRPRAGCWAWLLNLSLSRTRCHHRTQGWRSEGTGDRGVAGEWHAGLCLVAATPREAVIMSQW